MADRKASNKWIPPDFDPKKSHSINAYHGSHPLRERARKIKQGILVIRFEAPWNFWCESCGAHIGRGVRWNAEKKKVGAYYSTPIYAFTFTCHLCSGTIVFETDPKNCDYRITKGARRKKDTWDPEDAQSIAVPDQKEKDKRAKDPMYMLEHQAGDKARAAKEQPLLVRLMDLKERTSRFDYDANRLLRSSFRSEKKKLQAQEEADRAILAKSSLDIKLLPLEKEDVAAAKATSFGTPKPSHKETLRNAHLDIKRQSIFDSNSSSTTGTSSAFSSPPPLPSSSSSLSGKKGPEALKQKLLAHARANAARSKRAAATVAAATTGKSTRAVGLLRRGLAGQPLVRPARHNVGVATTAPQRGRNGGQQQQQREQGQRQANDGVEGERALQASKADGGVERDATGPGGDEGAQEEKGSSGPVGGGDGGGSVGCVGLVDYE